MSRNFLLAVMLGAIPLFAAPADFNGRWNITVANEPRNRAWWLEVNGAGTPAMKGRFVGAPGGQMDVIPEMRIEGAQLVWIFERAYAGKGSKSRGVYRARVEGGRLIGHFQVDGRDGSRLDFSGKRAPEIADRNDGQWRAGKPVDLFNGKDLSGWQSRFSGRPIQWRVASGLLKNEEKAADIATTAKFWNFKLQVVFRVGKGSNSGVGLRGRYEVQILEDAGRPLDTHSNGTIYSRMVPAVAASKPAGEWQTFDITLIGREVTVALNGKTVIDHQRIEGLTAMANDANEDLPGPISLQGDHGPVEFKKITLTPFLRP